MMRLRHDSRDLTCRAPFGAVPVGSPITLRLYADDPEPGTDIRLRLWRDGKEPTLFSGTLEESWHRVAFTFELSAGEAAGLLWYDFSVNSPKGDYLYRAPADGLGGEGAASEDGTPWQITVYEPQAVPSWAARGVMYQIYVDRFRVGPCGIHTEAAPDNALIHAHWSDTPFYIRDEKRDVVRWDFFGGNLEGVEEKLDELQALGVTVLYLNPIFYSFSNHKYDTADYRVIDPMYGGEAAFRSLVRALKERSMRLMLDGVFSHTGDDSRYFNRFGRFDALGAYESRESEFASWYKFEAWPDAYKCWWGVRTMPDVNELDPSYLAYQVTGEDSTVRQWLREGVDGFRLDVADELPDAFLSALKKVLREEKAEGFLLGEVWEDASNKISYDERRAYFHGHELDSVTNYPFRDTAIDLILGRVSAGQAARRMASLHENYPPAQFAALMNMTGTHDTVRLMTVFGTGAAEPPAAETERAAFRLSPQERAKAARRVRVFAAWQFTQPGLPTVYYGDEAGMEGFADPYNRCPYPWGHEDAALKGHFTRMAQLRHTQEALLSGSYRPFSDGAVYGHWRHSGSHGILTLITGPRGGSFTVEDSAGAAETLAAEGASLTKNGQTLNITLEAESYLILKLEEGEQHA